MAALILLLANACGSTVPEQTAASRGDRAGDAGDIDDSVLDDGVEAGGREEAEDTRVTTPKQRRGTSADRTSTTTTATTQSGDTRRGGYLPVGPGARGVADETIKLGMVIADYQAVAAAGAAIGVASPNQGAFDYRKTNAAALDVVNSQGGIAGRKAEGVYYFYNVANFVSASGREQENQRACAHWTEDNQVFAFAGNVGTEDVMAECAAKAKTPWVVVSYHLPVSQRRFSAMSHYYYNPPSFISDRRERSLANFLIGHDFFGPGAKVAIMTEDKPGAREGVDRGLKPTLAAAGIKVDMEIVYPDIIESPWANYVLQMKTRDIRHVVFSAQSARVFPALFMMRAAQDQRFWPTWGLGSDMILGSLANNNAPPDQLANVTAMGWKPMYDLYPDGQIGPPESPSAHLCADELKKRGQPDTTWGREQCEFAFFLRAGLEEATVVSPAGLAEGVARLGESYSSTITIGGATRFGPARHDGAEMARLAVYDRPTNRFKYAGPPQRVNG